MESLEIPTIVPINSTNSAIVLSLLLLLLSFFSLSFFLSLSLFYYSSLHSFEKWKTQATYLCKRNFTQEIKLGQLNFQKFQKVIVLYLKRKFSSFVKKNKK